MRFLHNSCLLEAPIHAVEGCIISFANFPGAFAILQSKIMQKAFLQKSGIFGPFVKHRVEKINILPPSFRRIDSVFKKWCFSLVIFPGASVFLETEILLKVRRTAEFPYVFDLSFSCQPRCCSIERVRFVICVFHMNGVSV